jgi:hypothetical protein
MHERVGPPSLDVLIADLARRQDGVVGHDQLVALGLDRGAIAHRIATGRLHPIHIGVYAVGHTVLSARGRRIGALLACGAGAVLSHQTAADHWNIRPSASPRIHVSLTTRSGRRRPGITIHRPRRLPAHETTRHEGLAITTVARTLLDLTDAVGVADLRKAIERSDANKLFNGYDVQSVIAQNPGRRTKKLERALHDADFGFKRSTLESDFLALCKRFGLPRPEVNVQIAGHEVDFFFREQRLVVETDGWKTHGRKRAFEDDRVRDVAMAKAGLQHVRFSHDRITGHAAEVAADVGSLLAL